MLKRLYSAFCAQTPVFRVLCSNGSLAVPVWCEIVVCFVVNLKWFKTKNAIDFVHCVAQKALIANRFHFLLNVRFLL